MHKFNTRREFLKLGAMTGLGMLVPPVSLGFGRSLPPFPTSDEMFGWASDIVAITKKHKQYRRSGTAGDEEVREYIKNKLISFGIPSVENQEYTFTSFIYDEWKLSVDGKDIPCFFWRDSKFTEDKGVIAEVVYVGKDIPLDGSVEGKIVVVDVVPAASSRKDFASMADYVHDPDGYFKIDKKVSSPNTSTNMPAAFYVAQKQGALGLIGILDFPTGTNQFYPDIGLAVRDLMPAVMVGKFDGDKLRKSLQTTRRPFSATIILKGTVNSRAKSGNVVATLPGVTDEILLINTHHDGCFTSAVEDASGIASVLALAKFYAAYVPDLRVKTLVFDFEGNHWSWDYPLGSRKFAEKNPEILAKTNAVLGIEHIAREMVEKDGKYVDAGNPMLSVFFSPESAELKEIAIEAIKINNLTHTIVPRYSGEDFMIPAQTRWFHLQNIPVYQYISGPEYLYLADDTLDKIDKSRFVPVNRAFIHLIERLQYIPRSRMIK